MVLGFMVNIMGVFFFTNLPHCVVTSSILTLCCYLFPSSPLVLVMNCFFFGSILSFICKPAFNLHLTSISLCACVGKWVYEVLISSQGLMQIGWCTLNCRFNQEVWSLENKVLQSENEFQMELDMKSLSTLLSVTFLL